MRAKSRKQERDRLELHLLVSLAMFLAVLVTMTIIALFAASPEIVAAVAALLQYLPPMP